VEIYLNGQRLDFRLEAERTVAEVAAALDRWLAAGSLCVTAVEVEGRPTQPSEWDRIAVAGAARLDVSVAHVSEARVAALRIAEPLLRDLAVGYPAMVEGIRTILAPQPGSELHAHLLALDQLLSGNTPERIARWPQETAQSATLALDGLALSVGRSLQETDDPLLALPRARAALLCALSEIEQVSVLLQTGRDRDAMGRVIAFSELTQSLFRIVSRLAPAALLVAGRPLQEFGGELNAILRQLLDAFDARDTVLIGDLLEYETAPRLRQLVDASGTLESPALPSGRIAP
jgi:hypothetical protein